MEEKFIQEGSYYLLFHYLDFDLSDNILDQYRIEIWRGPTIEPNVWRQLEHCKVLHIKA
jgi:hypothetical protein